MPSRYFIAAPRSCRHFFYCFIFALVFSAFAAAQTESATLSGTVMDTTGAVVPDVQVQATNSDTNVTSTTATNGSGIYVLPSLKPGRYRITVSKHGFKQVVVTDVVLNVQDTISRNFHLDPGAFSESITVSSNSAGVELSPAVTTTIDRVFVENMPLNGRSFQALIALAPGMIRTTGSGQFSFNGQRDNTNYLTVDGVSANIGVGKGFSLGGTTPGFNAQGATNNLLSMDALQEFKVSTSAMSAEYGRGPGAQIQLTSRSGTNAIRGSVYEYLRNEKLDANDWFANRADKPRAEMRQNDFGVTIGGPIIRNRTFFFASYEGLQLRQPHSVTWDVPSLSIRRDAPADLQPLLNAYPLPDEGSTENMVTRSQPYNASYSDPSSANNGSIRIDQVVNNHLTLFGRYSRSLSDSALRNLSYTLPTEVYSDTLTLGSSWSIDQSTIDELRFNYSTLTSGSFYKLGDFNGSRPPDSSYIQSLSPEGTTQLSWVMLNSGLLSTGTTSDIQQQQFNIVNTVSMLRGAHNLKFGFDYRNLRPMPELSNQITYQILSPADLLASKATTIFFTNSGAAHVGLNNFSAYIQDSWKVRRRLTLDLGLRWDVNPAPHGRDGDELRTLINIDDPSNIQLAPSGTPMYPTRWNAFAPRAGFALVLLDRPGREAVLRGGYGMFYTLGSGNVFEATHTFPQLSKRTLRRQPFPLDSSQLVPPPAPSLDPPYVGQQFYVFDPGYVLPRAHEWNLTFEQAFGTANRLTISYVGNAGRRLLRQERIDGPSPTFRSTPIFVTQNGEGTSDSSDYHSLQVQFQRRLTKGLQLISNYTWSHAIDTNAEDDFVNNRSDKLAVTTDRANSSLDRRHIFNIAVTYELPSVRSFGPVLSGISRNWAVDAIFKAQSAAPFDVVYTRDLGWGFINIRPDANTAEPVKIEDPSLPGGFQINPAAFSIPTEPRQGNVGRNTIRLFGQSQLDFAVRREFRLSERFGLQIRGEFYNLPNHPSFSGVFNVMGTYFNGKLFPSTIFGKARSMGNRSWGSNAFNSLYQIGGPRSVQLAVKLTF